MMNCGLKESQIKELYDFIRINWSDFCIYFWIDVWKMILDIGVIIWKVELSFYLWNIENSVKWFKKLEDVILMLIQMWINENNLFFWTENTWIYGHDIMNYFDDRLPNTYILNSNLTCNARKYYAKTDLKSDDIDSIVIATALCDLDEKNKLESIKNPFNKKSGLWFVRRSFANERNSLRILFRRLSVLRVQKSKAMASINLSKERLFPEIIWLFSIKHRSKSEAILLNNFTRELILSLTKIEFLQRYRKLAPKRQCNSRILKKVEEFYDKIIERWYKNTRSGMDLLMWKNSDIYIKDDIRFKIRYYDLISDEISAVSKKIWELLSVLELRWCFIPKFVWINKVEIWLILWELWFDIYQMTSQEFIWFVWWYPETYTSWWWHMVKEPRLSRKRGIIKKFLYVWMYGFMLHNCSFRLYKKLLTLKYSVNEEWKSVSNIKNKRKVEVKCWEKLLKIIHDWFKNKRSFSEELFINNIINPLILDLKQMGFWACIIYDEVVSVYWDKIPWIIVIG